MEELADVDADVGLVAVYAELAADVAACVDVAPLLHVEAYVFAAQSDGVEADIVDLADRQAMVFEILYEGWMGGLQRQAVAVHELLGIGRQFLDPCVIGFLEFLMVGYLACQI